MENVEFTARFQAIETELQLFQKKAGDVYFWDIVRYDIFVTIMRKLQGQAINPQPLPDHKSKSELLRRLVASVRDHSKMFIFRLRKSPRYVGFVCSRYKEDERYVDHASADVTKMLQGRALLLETYLPTGSILGSSTLHDPGPFFRRFFKLFNQPGRMENASIYAAAAASLKEAFQVDIDIATIIASHVDNYKADLWYYSRIFRIIRPSAIFVVQNGVRKGIYQAAKNLGIPTVELQHGLVGYIHPAYSYPAGLPSRELVIVPDYFFSFSSFWTQKINYPVREMIPIGNNFYSTKINKEKPIYALTFILASIYTKDMMTLINSLLANGFKREIAIKLHPNQREEYEFVSAHYAGQANITVLSLDTTIAHAIKVSEAFLAIQSTVVYEVLANGLKVLLYGIKDFRGHADIFDNPDVYIVNNAREIVESLQKPLSGSQPVEFFKEFDAEMFDRFLNRI